MSGNLVMAYARSKRNAKGAERKIEELTNENAILKKEVSRLVGLLEKIENEELEYYETPTEYMDSIRHIAHKRKGE